MRFSPPKMKGKKVKLPSKIKNLKTRPQRKRERNFLPHLHPPPRPSSLFIFFSGEGHRQQLLFFSPSPMTSPLPHPDSLSLSLSFLLSFSLQIPLFLSPRQAWPPRDRSHLRLTEKHTPGKVVQRASKWGGDSSSVAKSLPLAAVGCVWKSFGFPALLYCSPATPLANLGVKRLSTLPFSECYPLFPMKMPRSSTCLCKNENFAS